MEVGVELHEQSSQWCMERLRGITSLDEGNVKVGRDAAIVLFPKVFRSVRPDEGSRRWYWDRIVPSRKKRDDVCVAFRIECAPGYTD